MKTRTGFLKLGRVNSLRFMKCIGLGVGLFLLWSAFGLGEVYADTAGTNPIGNLANTPGSPRGTPGVIPRRSSSVRESLERNRVISPGSAPRGGAPGSGERRGFGTGETPGGGGRGGFAPGGAPGGFTGDSPGSFSPGSSPQGPGSGHLQSRADDARIRRDLGVADHVRIGSINRDGESTVEVNGVTYKLTFDQGDFTVSRLDGKKLDHIPVEFTYRELHHGRNVFLFSDRPINEIGFDSDATRRITSDGLKLVNDLLKERRGQTTDPLEVLADTRPAEAGLDNQILPDEDLVGTRRIEAEAERSETDSVVRVGEPLNPLIEAEDLVNRVALRDPVRQANADGQAIPSDSNIVALIRRPGLRAADPTPVGVRKLLDGVKPQELKVTDTKVKAEVDQLAKLTDETKFNQFTDTKNLNPNVNPRLKGLAKGTDSDLTLNQQLTDLAKTKGMNTTTNPRLRELAKTTDLNPTMNPRLKDLTATAKVNPTLNPRLRQYAKATDINPAVNPRMKQFTRVANIAPTLNMEAYRSLNPSFSRMGKLSPREDFSRAKFTDGDIRSLNPSLIKLAKLSKSKVKLARNFNTDINFSRELSADLAKMGKILPGLREAKTYRPREINLDLVKLTRYPQELSRIRRIDGDIVKITSSFRKLGTISKAFEAKPVKAEMSDQIRSAFKGLARISEKIKTDKVSLLNTREVYPSLAKLTRVSLSVTDSINKLDLKDFTRISLDPAKLKMAGTKESGLARFIHGDNGRRAGVVRALELSGIDVNQMLVLRQVIRPKALPLSTLPAQLMTVNSLDALKPLPLQPVNLDSEAQEVVSLILSGDLVLKQALIQSLR